MLQYGLHQSKLPSDMAYSHAQLKLGVALVLALHGFKSVH